MCLSCFAKDNTRHQKVPAGSPIRQSMWFGNCPSIFFIQCLFYLVIFIFDSNVIAGGINPKLSAKLSSTSPQEIISVEIEVDGGISAGELNAYLDSTCETLPDRRREGVLLLQEIANDTKTDLLKYLRELKEDGHVLNIRSHWLTNTITVDLASSGISKIDERNDIKEIFQYPELIPIEPEKPYLSGFTASKSEGGIEENLRYIGADSAWNMGYTGEGRIVCKFCFSGVEAKHPALYNNWKGHDGNPAAAWLGNWTEDGYPTTSNNHGTLIVGIMCGHDDLTGDTIGVAPGAEWIGVDGIAWEWAANPDGDPYTTDDVPDVINISIGWGNPCAGKYNDLIDMTEALGIVNIIAAGNGGGSPYSMYDFANRALDSITNFAVGSIDYRSGLVWWSSSRGPSICDSISIKPNVTAPGAYIRTSTTGGQYEINGGTSLAAPHVAGAVAILRQCAPNASVREIKQALLAGCTPRGVPSPNNNYGWGVINIPASIEYLSSRLSTDLRVVSYDYIQTKVQDTIGAEVRLKNRGYPVDSVYMKSANNIEGISVLTDSIYFGALNVNQTSNGNNTLQVLFDDTMYAGAIIPIDYSIYGSNGYFKSGALSFQAGIEGERSYFTHKNDILQFTISNFGQYNDFRLIDTTKNLLYESALLIGTDIEHISDGFRNMSLESDDDFWYDASDSLEVRIPGAIADQETFCVFNDGRAENRIGVQIKQSTYSWDMPPDNNYVLIEYVIENVSNGIIDGLAVGLALDWNVWRANYDYNCECNFSADENLGFLFKHTSESDSSWFCGATILNEEGVMSYKVLAQYNNGSILGPGVSDSVKFSALFGGLVDTNRVGGSHETLMHVIATGPFLLSPGETDTAYFAILGAESLNKLKLTAIQARDKVISLIERYALPYQFNLSQNYPNPFNQVTTIEFILPRASYAKLKVYNILGQQVTTLADRYFPKRHNTIIWDGTDKNGKSVASGIYLYRLTSTNNSETKKMILLK